MTRLPCACLRMVRIPNIPYTLQGECIFKEWRDSKMHKIYCCKGGLHLANIGTKNVSEPDLTPRMKYIMVRLKN